MTPSTAGRRIPEVLRASEPHFQCGWTGLDSMGLHPAVGTQQSPVHLAVRGKLEKARQPTNPAFSAASPPVSSSDGLGRLSGLGKAAVASRRGPPSLAPLSSRLMQGRCDGAAPLADWAAAGQACRAS